VFRARVERLPLRTVLEPSILEPACRLPADLRPLDALSCRLDGEPRLPDLTAEAAWIGLLQRNGFGSGTIARLLDMTVLSSQATGIVRVAETLERRGRRGHRAGHRDPAEIDQLTAEARFHVLEPDRCLNVAVVLQGPGISGLLQRCGGRTDRSRRRLIAGPGQ